MRKRVKLANDPASTIVSEFARRKRAEFHEEGPESPARDDDDYSDEQVAISEDVIKAPSLGAARTPLIIAALAACAGLAIWWKMRTVTGGPSPTEAENLVIEGELARYEAEKRRYEAERERLRGEHRALSLDRDNTMKALQQLRSMADDNNGKFKKMYAPSKASFDSDISSYEEEQNIETAFALKNDLDDKKSKMLEKNTELGKQHALLLARAKGIVQRIEQVEAIYSESFDDSIIPQQQIPRQLPRQQLPRQQIPRQLASSEQHQ